MCMFVIILGEGLQMNLLIKLVKNTVFIFCYNKTFNKILNVKNNHSLLYVLLLCLPISLIYSIIDDSTPYISYPILILILSLVQTHMQKLSFEISFIASMIAYGITYVIYAICAFIVSIGVAVFSTQELHILPETILFYQSILAVLELLITILLCRLKRLKNGLPFIYNQKYTFLGVCISLCIVILSSVLKKGEADAYYFSLFLFVYIFTIMLVIYSQNSIADTYMEELTKRTIDDLNHQLLTKNQYYEELLADKEQLSTIVHRDNKLIPAMEMAVTTFIEDNTDSEQGKELLKDIKRLSQSRNNILELIDKKCNPLPLCHVLSIDNLLSYMQQRAEQDNIHFLVSFHCNIQDMIDKIIEMDDIYTLLADLIENAIIATTNKKGTHIMLSFAIIHTSYTIQITDSGTPFSLDVLLKMGTEKITTHKDETGSGIGMMQTFKILSKYQASLVINEYDTAAGLYTKTISIVFDNKNQFILYTNRDETETSQLYERPDLTVVHK